MKPHALVAGLGILFIELSRGGGAIDAKDRKSTRLNSSHTVISYAVFCLKKKEHKSELQSHSDLVCPLLLVTRRPDHQLHASNYIKQNECINLTQPDLLCLYDQLCTHSRM